MFPFWFSDVFTGLKNKIAKDWVESFCKLTCIFDQHFQEIIHLAYLTQHFPIKLHFLPPDTQTSLPPSMMWLVSYVLLLAISLFQCTRKPSQNTKNNVEKTDQFAGNGNFVHVNSPKLSLKALSFYKKK